MKKTLIISGISILLGSLAGIIFNNNYKEKIFNKINKKNNYYILQEGAYSSKEVMLENTKNISIKTLEKDNNKYYVYLGITKDIENAKKIKAIYENKGYQIYIKEVNISNEEFYNNVIQFDLLIKNTDNEQEVLTIEEVVLANYDELIKTDK